MKPIDHLYNFVFAFCIIFIVIIVMGLVLGMSGAQDDLDGRQANYCEMRSIYEQSGGLYGWPKMDNYGECK